MNDNIFQQYLEEKGLEYKLVNDQFNIKFCGNCGNEKWNHVYMNVNNGLADCKLCGFQGNFNQFRKLYNDPPIQHEDQAVTVPRKRVYMKIKPDLPREYFTRLLGTPELLEYYKKRGINQDSIDKFLLGFDGEYLTIPIYEKHNVVNMIYRWNPLKDRPDSKPKYKLSRGCKNVLFNIDKINPQEPILLTEGVLDGIKLIQEGYENVVSVTGGAGTFLTEWVEKFRQVKEIIIAYDNDGAGKKGMARVIKKLGDDRCKFLEIADGDVTDFFQSGKTKVDFDSLLRNASVVPDSEIKHVGDFGEETLRYLKEGDVRGLLTGIPEIDHFLNGFKRGNLYILSGVPSSGKTCLMMNMGYNMIQDKHPCMFFSFEMTNLELIQRMITIILQITGKNMETGLTEDELGAIGDLFPFMKEELPLFLYEGEGGNIKVKDMKGIIERGIVKYGLECVFIDHLHYFSSSITHTTNEIANITRTLRTIAKDLDIPIILAAHLNRTGKRAAGKAFYIPSMIDLKDSSSLEGDAHSIIFLCRDVESSSDILKKKVVYKIAKNRNGATGMAQAVFHPEKLVFGSVSGDPYDVDLGNFVEDSEEMGGKLIKEIKY
jgi:hypothetical protein